MTEPTTVTGQIDEDLTALAREILPGSSVVKYVDPVEYHLYSPQFTTRLYMNFYRDGELLRPEILPHIVKDGAEALRRAVADVMGLVTPEEHERVKAHLAEAERRLSSMRGW